jgi:exosortase J
MLRLCVLVIYYRIGVSFPSIQKHGAGVDYAIGGILFLLVALGLGMLIRSLEPGIASGMREMWRRGAADRPRSFQSYNSSRYHVVARTLCFLTLTLVYFVLGLRSDTLQQVSQLSEEKIVNSFPARVGPYSLTRTWTENSSEGTTNMSMAEYSTSPGRGEIAKRFTLGLWVGSANHRVADSKFIQGIQAQWNGSFNADAQQAFPVNFYTYFYDNGVSRQFDAESTCTSGGCWGRSSAFEHRGLFISARWLSNFFASPQGRSLPILLRREWLAEEPTVSAGLRAQFEADARLFISQIDLKSLVAHYGTWKG